MGKLLIVVDFQNDFVAGSLGFIGAETLDDKISNKIDLYRNSGGDVVFTYDTHQDNYLETIEGKYLPVSHCIENSDGWELYGKTGKMKQPGDRAFIKETFPSLDLANWLKDTNYKQVELVGLVSNICVLSNAIMVKSALPNAEIVVDSKCTASFDSDLNSKTMDILKGLHIKVIN